MKKLDFAQFKDAENMFLLVWLAFRATYPRKAAGYEQMKLCNRIGEKLEGISNETPAPDDPGARVLKSHGKVLFLEAMEHEKLLSMLKDEQLGWTHIAGRKIEQLTEAFEAAPAVDVEEKKPKSKK